MADYYNNPQQPPYQAQYQQPYHAPQQPQYQQPVDIESTLPPQYKPLSPWAYFGYSLLIGIPIVGFILAIVFSFNDDNINRRNFFRSFWCSLLLAVIIIVILVVIGLALGASLFNLFDLRYIFS